MLELLGDEIDVMYEQADEIVNGQIRLFGGAPVSLILDPPQPLSIWTNYERGSNHIGNQDIKYIWEPARFGWSCTLARAYHLSMNEQYAQTFWDYTEHFLASNPPFWGPHWSSSQEVAIRIVALAFAYQTFIQSSHSTPKRLEQLAHAIAVHAERIPPTMVYARSQNNNHLITEALGLYTASALLPEHPLAPKWHDLGWKWLQYAFRTQIDPEGGYIQHSTNYHRLMLQAAMWMFAVHDNVFNNDLIPEDIPDRLKTSTYWLGKLIDPDSGRVPNLGHNDGAYILPLTVCPYHDYKPVIYAAAKTFLNSIIKPDGPWCEMVYWLCHTPDRSLTSAKVNFRNNESQIIQKNNGKFLGLHNPVNGSWALFRIATYNSRPAHADQLHMDLWWHGLNLALDPGTYLYNSAPPWDNSLTSAFVHNTITVDGKEFMRRVSRFLYLDWAQAKVIKQETDSDHNISFTATHNGYQKLGLAHSRKITSLCNGNWEIIDSVAGASSIKHSIRLHWLLPDWEYEIRESPDKTVFPWYQIRIRSPYGWVSLNLGGGNTLEPHIIKFQVVRTGKILFGSGEVSPIFGWTSPTYGDKIPALACILEVYRTLPVELKSLWILPDET